MLLIPDAIVIVVHLLFLFNTKT